MFISICSMVFNQRVKKHHFDILFLKKKTNNFKIKINACVQIKIGNDYENFNFMKWQ